MRKKKKEPKDPGFLVFLTGWMGLFIHSSVHSFIQHTFSEC